MDRRIERRIRRIKKKNNRENFGTEIILSILILSSLEDRKKLQELSEKLIKEIEINSLKYQVEIITHIDNSETCLKLKKKNMIKSCGGRFFTIMEVNGTLPVVESVNKIKDNFYSPNFSLQHEKSNICFWNRENILVREDFSQDFSQIKDNENSKKIISFSLYGENKLYTENAIINCEKAKIFYKDWIVRIYYDNSVPEKTVSELKKYDFVEIIDMSKSEIKNGKFWRFLVLFEENIECHIIRDTDSHLSLRERNAVEKWLKSGKKFHVMRDHPNHSNVKNWPILAGLWGGKPDIKLREIFKNFSHIYSSNNNYGSDQDFLGKFFWNYIKNNCLVHDSFKIIDFGPSEPFPDKRINFEYVGSVMVDGKERESDTKILIDNISSEKYVSDDILLCYNFIPSVCEHILDISKKNYMTAVLKPLHNYPCFNPLKINMFDKVFVKTDLLNMFLQKLYPRIRNKFILLTSCSDIEVDEKYKEFLDQDKIVKWIGVNISFKHKKLFKIPIGFQEKDRSRGGTAEGIGGDQNLLMKFYKNRKKYEEKENKILVTNVSNTHSSRKHIHRDLNKDIYTHLEKVPFENYMDEINKYRFVLSPRGNGIDTHRFWEISLSGSVPIVENSGLDDLYEKFPCIIVKNFQDITENTIKNFIYDEEKAKNIEKYLLVENLVKLF